MSNIFENKGALATTIVVAASDSLNEGAANYICDGTADDVEINAALAAGAGGKIILLEGNYQITANLVIPASTHFSGMGKGTILTTTAAIGITNMVLVNGDNVTISDMKLVLGAGAGDAGSRPNIIYASSKTLIWLENLWLVGDLTVADDGSQTHQCGVVFYTVTESKILNCRSENNKRHGIAITDTSTYNSVLGNTIKGNTRAGLFLFTDADYNEIVANTIQDNGYWGIELSGADNCNVSGNIVRGNSTEGIDLASSSNNSITDNSVQGNTRNGIKVRSGSLNNTITGNTCADNDTGGNLYSGIVIENANQNVVTGNQCDANGLHGIRIIYSSYCTISGNVCSNQNTGDGINIIGSGDGNSDYNDVVGNNCYHNASNGIEVVGGTYTNYNLVKANVTMGNTGRGIVDAGTNTIFDQVMHSIALDLTGGATDIEVFHAKCPCILAGYTVLYSVATGGGAGVNIRVGRYQDGVALDDDYFDVSVSELNKNKGYSKHFVSADLIQSVIASGDTVTVGTAGGKADTGEIILVLEIAEMSD